MKRSDLQAALMLWHLALTVAVVAIGATGYPYGVPHPLLLVGLVFAVWSMVSMFAGWAVSSKPPKDDY
jgi:uncharacterized membrane protein (DUF441 family)